MQENRLKSYLETVTNILVLAVSILVLGIFAWSYLRPTPKTKFQSGLQIGQRFAPLSGIEFRDYPQTLLVALNSKCTYCNESIAFYQQLTNLQGANRFTRVVALSSETEDIVKPYLSNNQINIRTVPSTDFSTANISATPTLILVNSKGTIVNFWIGKLSQEKEQQVLKAMTTSE